MRVIFNCFCVDHLLDSLCIHPPTLWSESQELHELQFGTSWQGSYDINNLKFILDVSTKDLDLDACKF